MICPRCDCDDAVEVGHPGGRWLCAECDQLFDGGGMERLNMANQRRAFLDRRSPVYGPPLPGHRRMPEAFSTSRRGR